MSVRKFAILFLLLTANILNYADRSILSVLAEELRRDLSVSDAELGFLYGTSFAVVNAILCFAMARLADVWFRNRLLAFGVFVWSILTMASGLVRNFTELAVARFGIGLGEATISPVSFSYLADTFPARLRGFVFGIYMSGPFLGTALCLTAGGWFVAHWADTCGLVAGCGLKGWQAAFIAFGAPGIFVALLVALIREPGDEADVRRRRRTRPFLEGASQVANIVPPFSFIQIRRLGGSAACRMNLKAFAAIGLLATILIAVTGNPAQWVAVGLAFYAIFSWNLALIYSDPPAGRLIALSPAFLSAVIGGALNSVVSASVGFWSVPYAMREFELDAFEAGALLAPAMAFGGIIGTVGGGIVADLWKRRTLVAPFLVCILAIVGSAAALALMLVTNSSALYALAVAILMMLGYSWPAAASALGQDLILPTMRARGSAAMSNVSVVVGMSVGPFLVGFVSDLTGSVALGLSSLFAFVPIAVGIFLFGMANLPKAYAARDHELARTAQLP